jgi:GNAT superfamily N-acetyltransferase
MIVHDGITTRIAIPADATAISSLIAATLRQTNAADYPATVIDRMTISYGAPRIVLMVQHREMFVAERIGQIVGVIGYAAGSVRSLFVAPDHQGSGVGRRLVAEVESLARKAGLLSLTVAASMTAIGFYQRCGFEELRPVDPAGIDMMLMHKWLHSAGLGSHLGDQSSKK